MEIEHGLPGLGTFHPRIDPQLFAMILAGRYLQVPGRAFPDLASSGPLSSEQFVTWLYQVMFPTYFTVVAWTMGRYECTRPPSRGGGGGVTDVGRTTLATPISSSEG